ncbi:C40 family peptidase [Polaribacter vadi]|uniref:C40 family peptidase n=1 Tax=Polaribacter TaxID=52959 RepID=UPI001C0A42E0|nr:MULTISPECIES: C40 family peptidase [Polaribacter]MBU3012762.1 C40 family peptidase [Polaribacter vadi]MDO6742578.1 C40 family peptidase [Polaribacter sp. 1_MG-2023]
MKSLKYILLFVLILFISCNNKEKELKKIKQYASLLKMTETPDQRVALFNVDINYEEDKIKLEGITTTKAPMFKLMNSLSRKKIKYINEIRVLPDTAVGDLKYAIARNSVINIRSQPKHSAELGTQGLLGMPLKVLDKKGDFYRVQTPDKYISWVDKGGITRMNKADFDAWNNEKKVIFTKNFGAVFSHKSDKSQIISDITLGGILKYKALHKDFIEVEYPDKRTGFVKRDEATLFESWLTNLQVSQSNIEEIAKSMDGFPYLWGGTSSKGMDCSGFTKMVYLMNGFIIPRDASQQVYAGQIVDSELKFEGLEKGDLMFFGKKATAEKGKKVTHVGIWLGNGKGEFIHASGNVHISSIEDYQPNYDEFNKNRYLGSRRYLGVEDKNIINLKEKIKL